MSGLGCRLKKGDWIKSRISASSFSGNTLMTSNKWLSYIFENLHNNSVFRTKNKYLVIKEDNLPEKMPENVHVLKFLSHYICTNELKRTILYNNF